MDEANNNLVPFEIARTGVDIAGGISNVILQFGTIAAVVLGGYAAFLVIRRGMRWMGKAI